MQRIIRCGRCLEFNFCGFYFKGLFHFRGGDYFAGYGNGRSNVQFCDFFIISKGFFLENNLGGFKKASVVEFDKTKRF